MTVEAANAANVNLYSNKEMKLGEKVQQSKVDLSEPKDKVELKSKNKTKTGAKIGVLAGLAYGAISIKQAIPTYRELIEIGVKNGASKTMVGAALGVGMALGVAIASGVGAGIGALGGKIAGHFSHKSDK